MAEFQTGDHGDISGIEWRVVAGRKGPSDVRLEIRCRDWVPPSMAFGGLQTVVYYENEDRLYPQEKGYRGGRKYLDYLRDCLQRSWREATDALNEERKRAAEKRAA